ncbi:MAG: ribonuclease H-like domain-containing protein [Eubacterium sp.]|nr:ribonuclease H-like domain-containing protein [Eubacterium sp.]
MLTFTYERSISELPEASLFYLNEEMLFFDLETTGLSASRNRIYLVGLGWLEGDQVIVRQYLAEDASDEASVLAATLSLASEKRFTALATFNGTTFDLPFFEKRCEKHAAVLEDVVFAACDVCSDSDTGSSSRIFSAMDHLDLYRQIHPIRHFFPMEHFRQKDYEKLLGIGREDQYDGGKLVSVYHRFEKTKKQADCDLLCLHNKEDVFGMFHLISLLACLQVKEEVSIDSLQVTSANEVSVRFRLEVPVPISIRQLKTTGSLLLRKTSGLAVLPLYKGALRCYLPNPKDYFYLTAEDTVVHKSVGQFVDPAFRRKAEPEECYTEFVLPAEYLDGEVHPYCENSLFENVEKALEGFLRQV